MLQDNFKNSLLYEYAQEQRKKHKGLFFCLLSSKTKSILVFILTDKTSDP